MLSAPMKHRNDNPSKSDEISCGNARPWWSRRWSREVRRNEAQNDAVKAHLGRGLKQVDFRFLKKVADWNESIQNHDGHQWRAVEKLMNEHYQKSALVFIYHLSD
jgi:hypothetical protein